MISEPQSLTSFGFADGYFIYRDGRIWSERTRGKAAFKNLDYTGCTLLKTESGVYVRKSAKLLAFHIYEVPELLSKGFVWICDGAVLINRDGVAYSTSAGCKLVWNKNKDYFSISVKGKSILVHRAVAQAFIPNPNKLPEVDHIDGNKANNSVSNLRWIDRSGNMKAAYKLGALDESLKRAFAAKGLKFNPKQNTHQLCK